MTRHVVFRVAVNLSHPDRRLTALLTQISMLDKKARSLQRDERRAVIDQILAEMAEYDISLADLETARAQLAAPRAKPVVRARKPAVAKYRDPETGLTWSGHGRPPAWITAAEARGQSREHFLLPITQLFGIDVPPESGQRSDVDMSALSRALQEIDGKS